MPAKIFIATPAYGNMVSASYMRSVLGAIPVLAAEGIEFMFYTLGNESLVTRARNMCVANFLNTDCTHLLFIDSDIEFEPDVIRRLVASQKDLACACYPLKGIRWDKIRSLGQGLTQMSDKEIEAASLAYNVQVTDKGTYNRPVVNGFIEVDYAATGFMLIKRTVLTKMRRGFPELKYNCPDVDATIQQHLWAFFDTLIDENKMYLSEDWTFCKRWRSLGGEIWLDLVSHLTHHGSHGYSGCVGSSMNFGPVPPPK